MPEYVARPRIPYLRFGPKPGTPELWACSYDTLQNVVYYDNHDASNPLLGYHCVRVPAPADLSNSSLFRLAKLLLKFTDGLPIP